MSLGIEAGPNQARTGPSTRFLIRQIGGLDLPQQAKHLLIVLAVYQGDNAIAWPSQETLGDDLGIGERAVRKWIGVLKNANLITQGGTRYKANYAVQIATIDAQTTRTKHADGRLNTVGSDRPTVVGSSVPDERIERPDKPKRETNKEHQTKRPDGREAGSRFDFSWKTLGRRLKDLGVAGHVQAVAKAKARGLTPERAEVILSEWSLRSGDYDDAGPLYLAIAAGTDWPPSAIAKAREAKAKADRTLIVADAMREVASSRLRRERLLERLQGRIPGLNADQIGEAEIRQIIRALGPEWMAATTAWLKTQPWRYPRTALAVERTPEPVTVPSELSVGPSINRIAEGAAA